MQRLTCILCWRTALAGSIQILRSRWRYIASLYAWKPTCETWQKKMPATCLSRKSLTAFSLIQTPGNGINISKI